MSRHVVLFEGTKINAEHGTPTPKEIAVSLGRLVRFCGNGSIWFCVLLHTFVVCDLVSDRLKIYALLHDAAECTSGDLPTPFKTADVSYREHKVFDRICKAAGLPKLSSEDYFLLKAADRRAPLGEVHTSGPVGLRTEFPRDPEVERS